MKKIVALILAMVMSFALVACSGANHDANNAAMQAKIDEMDRVATEIVNWYTDKGYLEGDTAATVQPIVDKIKANTEEIKASHQEVLDKGGYTDEEAARISVPIDEAIANFKDAKEKLDNYDASAAAGTGIAVVTEKFNALVELVNAASEKATETGWDKDEAFSTELKSGKEYLELVKSDLDKGSLDETYMNTLITSLDEMIPAWQGFVTMVSEPYTK